MKGRRSVLFVSLLFLSSQFTGRAATIWNNGGPAQGPALASDADPAPGQEAGDDFTVATAVTANQIQWWGVYLYGNSPTTPDNFTIRLFNITGGVPGTVPFFQSVVGDVTEVDSGLDLQVSSRTFDIYAYSAFIPNILLGPGTYLLSIVNDTTADLDDTWNWVPSGEPGTARVRSGTGPWSGRNVELAFNISGPDGDGTSVPDTGTTALLFGTSFVALLALHRRASAVL